MEEITIISGKGGAGKTSVTAAFASIAENAVFTDNDVDAADLHLILDPQIIDRNSFDSGTLAVIDQDKCADCNLCAVRCRFEAIKRDSNNLLYVDEYSCEGCRLCERICPFFAIHSVKSENNWWFVSDTRFGPLVHGQMAPGQENSGRLVTLIRNNAKKIAQEKGLDLIVNDGPPGVGCSAISSVSGAKKILMVVEPTISGLHDIIRLNELVDSFKIPKYALINKADINLEMTEEIEFFLRSEGIHVLGKLPFDEDFVNAMVEGKSIIEFAPNGDTSLILKDIWEKLLQSGN